MTIAICPEDPANQIDYDVKLGMYGGKAEVVISFDHYSSAENLKLYPDNWQGVGLLFVKFSSLCDDIVDDCGTYDYDQNLPDTIALLRKTADRLEKNLSMRRMEQ